jgi:hypothetical protein
MEHGVLDINIIGPGLILPKSVNALNGSTNT